LLRNPIYTGMCGVALGLALLLPNLPALLALALLGAGLEVQVRLVEEPYLMRKQGEAYSSWAARTGRFFPAVGRLR
jgi:protein-S-isoprenylcysteine O-methyltransferase Ste14